ncbi:hypothetical protein EMPS_03753 [Entomortierella parvispora]|uniref:C2H2-type domain-containing protein n=1 Tax=Entomortierella parvispora TaxID=205924 RepID=A0A9P3H7D9_9FUNG|nr:hypothetical protein EMPS_03753 [Entomortierella parvispora]
MDPDQGQEPLLPFHLQDNPSNPYNGRPLSSQPSYYTQQQQQHQPLSEEGVFSNQGHLLSPIEQQQHRQQQQQSLEQVHHIRSPNEYSNYLASDLHKAHPTPQQQHHQQMQQQMQQQQMQELGPSLGPLHHHQQQTGHHHFQSPQQQQHPYHHRRHQHDQHQHDQQREEDLRQQQRHLLPHQAMYSSTSSLEQQQQQQQHGQLYMQSQQQQQQQQQHQISDATATDPSTPASTAASTMTSGSAASTPLLPSTASLLSPVAFHISSLSQNQGQGQNMGSNLASPPSDPQPGAAIPLGMHPLAWTTTPATPDQLPNAQDVQSKRQQQTFLGSDAQAHAHDHAHDNAPAHAHGHGHHPLSPLPPPLSNTLAQAHGHPPSQPSQQQLPARDSPASPSQAQLLRHHAQDQHHHHQQQQQSQMWVGMHSDSAFHSPEGVLGQQQQQVRPSMKQSKSFGMDTMEHQPQSYPPGYTDHQGMATVMQRHRVQSARQVFARNLMDYTDDYSLGQGQGHPHQQQQQQQQHSPGTPLTPQHHTGLPTMVDLPLLPSSQLLQQDPQGFTAMSMSMLHHKTMSSPASLGPMAMGFNGDGSHPSMMGAHSQDYGSPTDVVSYPMPLHHDNFHHRSLSARPPSRNAHSGAAGGGGSGAPGSIRPAPPNTLHRTSSAGPGAGATSVRPSRRFRTSSMNAVPTSSFGSRSLLSSITSSLGATSLTFPDYPASSSSSPIPLTSIQAAQQGAGPHGREESGGGVPTIAIGLESHSDMTSPTAGGLDYTRYSRSDGSPSMGNMGGGHRFGNRISTATGGPSSMSKSSPSGLSVSTSSSSLQFSSQFGSSASGSSASGSSTPSSNTNKPTTLSNFMANHQMNRKQTAIRNFACSFPGCPKAYTQLHNLKSHERTGHTPVTKPKPFLCIIPGCPKAFSQRKSLAIHIKANHKEYRYKPFKCGQAGCPKAYTQLHNLRTHEKTVHSLDLSRKRIRIPTPPRTGGGSSGGRAMGGHPYQPQDPTSGGGGGGGGGMDYVSRGLSQSQRDMGLSYGHEANDDDDEEEEEAEGEDGEEDNDDPADGNWRNDDGGGGQYGGPR